MSATNTATKALGQTLNVGVKQAGSIAEWITGYSIPGKTFLWAFGIIFFILLITGITIILQKRSTMSTPSNVERIQGTQMKEVETILAPFYKKNTNMYTISVDPLERCLVNYAPLTCMNPGYLGPLTDGVYKEEDGIAMALKAGARCFVLPIDYHDDETLKPPLFAAKGEPCLLMRDAGGAIRSLNSGSIQRITQALANVAFNDILPNKNDPLVVMLYFIRTPPPESKQYLRYLSSVARQLNPLIQYCMGQTSEGVYNRQGRQNELLYTDVRQFERKALIFSNIDTSLFRNPKSVGLPTFPLREDLDFWVNLRMFKQSEEDLGATNQADQKTFMRGLVEKVSYYTFLPEKQRQTTIDTNKIRWVMALSEPGKNPSAENTTLMLNTLGVQCIPLSLFAIGKSEEDTSLLTLWKDNGWRFKPQAVRFRKPEPFKPLQPSPKLNAQQGKLTSPSL